MHDLLLRGLMHHQKVDEPAEGVLPVVPGGGQRLVEERTDLVVLLLEQNDRVIAVGICPAVLAWLMVRPP